LVLLLVVLNRNITSVLYGVAPVLRDTLHWLPVIQRIRTKLL